MTALQDLDQAELEFRDHCREAYEGGALVYQQDSALIERMARKVSAFASSMAADFAKLNARDNPNLTPAADVAQLVAEALDRDLNVEAARLFYAQVRYLGSLESAASDQARVAA